MSKIYLFLLLSLAWCSTASAHIASGWEVGPGSEKARPITGTVTDENGSGLPGVNIIIEGTTVGTVTDADGKFTIEVPSDDAVLVVSFIGYETQKITVGSLAILDVKLAPDVKSLEEVVVVGYSTQKRNTLTGAVATIDNKDIVRTKNENVLNSLTGKLPGVRIVQKSAAPGAYDTQIDIRGMGTPLFVIDGIVRDQAFFSRMSSEEIENVSILKDGSAAIYGLGAANGVVLVTTKKGVSNPGGKVDVTLSSSMSFQQFLYVPKSVGAADYMTLKNEQQWQDFGKNYLTRTNPVFTDEQIEAYRNGTKQSYDWFDQVFRKTTPQTQTDLTIGGGNEKVKYFFNLGYSKQEGSYRSGDYYSTRLNMRMNIDAQITKRLSARLAVGSIMVDTHQPTGTGWSTYKLTWLTRPDAPFYANDNPEYPNGDSNLLNEGANMIEQTKSSVVGYTQNKDTKYNGTLTLEYEIPGIKGLSAKGVYDYSPNLTYNTSYQRAYDLFRYNPDTDTYSKMPRNQPAGINKYFGLSYSTNMQTGLHYNNSFGSHNVQGFVIYEQRYNNYDNYSLYRQLQVNSQYLFAGEVPAQNASQDKNGLFDIAKHSVIGSANYDYAGKYLLDFKFRYDGSSRFPVKNRYGFFPAVSAGWRLSEEGFIKDNISFLSNLKLRASYGEMADDGGFSPYPPAPGYVLDGGQYAWIYGGGNLTGGVSPAAIPNPNLTWYNSKIYNAGIDFGFLNKKLNGTFDVYKRDQTGLRAVSDVVIPGTVGAQLPEINYNAYRNFGYEVALRYTDSFKEFNYYVGGQISATKGKWTKRLETPAGNSYDRWRNRTNGRYDNIWWGNESQTQLTSYDQIQNYNLPLGQNTLPGDWVLNDWNQDGVVNDQDQHPIASVGLPVFNYGISLGGSWRNFDIALDWQGAYGVYVQYAEVLTEALPFGGQNTLDYFMDRWRPVDPNADYFNPNTQWIPGYYPVTGHDGRRTGTNGVQNASYIRLKTAQIGYNFPKSWVSKVGMQSARLYVSGYNVLTFTGLKNVDPERPTAGSGDSYVQFYNYPVNKTYTVGASIKF